MCSLTVTDPTANATMSVAEVTVMATPACFIVRPIRSATEGIDFSSCVAMIT